MHLRRPLTAPFLVALVLLVVFVAGCGGAGGGQQSDGGESGEAKEQQNGDAKKKKKNRPEVKVALGKVKEVIGEKNRILVLEPSSEAQGTKKTMVFRIREKAKVTLAGEEAELADIQAGQQAQIEYVRKEDRNRARSLTLFKPGETPTSEGGG